MGISLHNACIMLLAIAFAAGAPAHARGAIEVAGDIITVAIPVTGFVAANNKQDHEGKIQLAKTLGADIAVTLALKALIDKRRPNGDCCDSFPSGHTSVSFSGATFLYRRYGTGYGAPAFIGASLVGYSRVQSDKHFVEDVLAGAAIGLLSGYFLASSYPGLEITPLAADGFFGISFRKQW